MDIIQLAVDLFMKNSSDTNLHKDKLINGFKGLLSNDDGTVDLQGVVARFSQRGLGDLLSSWIGKNDNSILTAAQIDDVLGHDKIDSFANTVGITSEDATDGLAVTIPSLIEQLSSNGSLFKETLFDKALSKFSGFLH